MPGASPRYRSSRRCGRSRPPWRTTAWFCRPPRPARWSAWRILIPAPRCWSARSGGTVRAFRQSAVRRSSPCCRPGRAWRWKPNADTVALRPTPQGFVVAGAPHSVAGVGHRGPARAFGRPDAAVRLPQPADRGTAGAAAAPDGRGRGRAAACPWPAPSGGGSHDDRARTRRRGAAPCCDWPRPTIRTQADSPDNAALTSIAALLAHRPDEAQGLADPRLPAADDIALWRAVRLAQLHEGSPPAAATFAATLPLLLTYPPEMRDRVLPLVGRNPGGRW